MYFGLFQAAYLLKQFLINNRNPNFERLNNPKKVSENPILFQAFMGETESPH